MNKQPHSAAREMIVADAIRDVVNELRLVDVADYIAFLKLESMASIADIVESAAELFFMPGALCLGNGGEAHIGWDEKPCIVLDLELRPGGAVIYFTLSLTAANAAVEVNYVSFNDASPDPEVNTRFLETAIFRSQIRKSVPAHSMR